MQHHRDQDTEDPADGADENGDQVDRDVGPADDAHLVEEVDEPEEDHAHDSVDDERGDAFDHFVNYHRLRRGLPASAWGSRGPSDLFVADYR